MKKFLIYFCVVLILVFMMWSIAHADGGFLNVSYSGLNTHGGTLSQADFSFNVNYDGGTDVVKGNIQGFGFPRHTDPSVPLSYTVTAEPTEGYTFSLEEKDHLGCSDSLPAGKMLIVNCTIYFKDDGYPLPASASVVVDPSPVSDPISPEIVTNDPIASSPVQNEPIVKSTTTPPQATSTFTRRFTPIMVIASTTDISASTTQIIASQARLIAVLEQLITLLKALMGFK